MANKETYNLEDLLDDKCFVDAVKRNDKKALLKWEKELIAGNLDADLLAEAKLLVKLFEEEPGEEEEVDLRVQQLWVRVNDSVHRRRSRRWITLTAASAAVILLAFISLRQILQRSNYNEMRHAKEMLLSYQGDIGDQIMLIDGEDSINVEGDFAEIEHNEEERISINHKWVDKKSAPQEKVAMLRLIVPKGKRSFLKLSDGSTLWVNSGSQVVYPVAFNEDKREIFLDGEIYGDIAKDPQRAFSVHTERLEVTVLGTELNVQAYRADQKEAVVLVTGLVEVKPEKAKAERLTPGKMAVMEQNRLSVTTVNVQDYVSWKEGYYRFKNETLTTVAKKLSRYYGVEVTCDPDAGKLKCSGGIFLQDDLKDILEGLCISLPISYVKSDNDYYLQTNTN
ncbi:DUF4974 domain-containing protein [Dysgonomonadaceae bacterium zrk40]|nr:DUF4974 domain-containing protein [Dysgonomonadaceae bacterium zrk40]